MKKKTILIITHEIPPIFDRPPSGGGIRVWSFQKALEAAGYHVVLAIPHAVFQHVAPLAQLAAQSRPISEKTPGARRPPPRHRAVTATDVTELCLEGTSNDVTVAYFKHRIDLDEMIARAKPHALLSVYWEPLYFNKPPDVPLILDLPAALCLEGAYLKDSATDDIIPKLSALAQADFYIFSNERLRSYFLSWLIIAGVDSRKLPEAIIPISFPPCAPSHEPPPEPVLLCGGVFHPWMDSSDTIARIARHLAKRRSGKLRIIGGRHPMDFDGKRKLLSPLDELPRSRRIVVSDMLPFQDYILESLSSSVGVALSKPTIEREHSSSFRIVNYLWCGLPVITGTHCPMAELIKEYSAGWVVPYDHRNQLEELLDRILESPELIRAYSENARKLALDRFTWNRTMKPLLDYLDKPVMREERTEVPLISRLARDRAYDAQTIFKKAEEISRTRGEVARVAAERKKLSHELDSLRQKFHDLEKASESSKAALNEKTHELEALKHENLARAREVEFLANERGRLSDELVKLSDRMGQLGADLLSKNLELSRLEEADAQSQRLLKENIEKTKETDFLSQERKRLSDEVLELLDRERALQAKLGEKSAENDSLAQERKRLSDEVAQLLQHQRLLDTKLGEKSAENDSLAQERKRLSDEVAQLLERERTRETKLAEKAAENDSLAQERKRLSDEVAQFLEREHSLQTKLAEKAAETDLLAQERKRLGDELIVLHERIRTTSTELGEKQGELSHLARERERLSGEITGAYETLGRKEGLLAETQNELSLLKAERLEVTKEVESISSSLDALEHALGERDARLQELSENLEKASAALAAANAELGNSHRHSSKLEERIAALSAELESTQAYLNSVRAELGKRVQIIWDMERVAAQRESLIAQLAARRPPLHRTLARLLPLAGFVMKPFSKAISLAKCAWFARRKNPKLVRAKLLILTAAEKLSRL